MDRFWLRVCVRKLLRRVLQRSVPDDERVLQDELLQRVPTLWHPVCSWRLQFLWLHQHLTVCNAQDRSPMIPSDGCIPVRVPTAVVCVRG